MCCNSMFGYSGQLLDRFKKALEESISSKVLPSLIDKNGVPLLIEHLHLWANYKVMITQDRNGVPVDRNLLQGISTFYVEVGAQGKTPYYDMFEEAIFADAATYYSQLASQWHLCYSSTNYVFKC
ncbi:hypothetical protein Pfo_005273 [Paulownia fortunei]|nr:hypothetical protein Pfo_005273 [Paulownia fortunei]